jgi:hypothetical protein
LFHLGGCSSSVAPGLLTFSIRSFQPCNILLRATYVGRPISGHVLALPHPCACCPICSPGEYSHRRTVPAASAWWWTAAAWKWRRTGVAVSAHRRLGEAASVRRRPWVAAAARQRTGLAASAVAVWGWLHHCVDGHGLPQLRIDGQGRRHLDAAGQGPPHPATAMRLTLLEGTDIPSWPHLQPFGNWMEEGRPVRWRVELQIALNTRKNGASRGGEAREKDRRGAVLSQICGARACFFGASNSWGKGWGPVGPAFSFT